MLSGGDDDAGAGDDGEEDDGEEESGSQDEQELAKFTAELDDLEEVRKRDSHGCSQHVTAQHFTTQQFAAELDDLEEVDWRDVISRQCIACTGPLRGWCNTVTG
jgi:hypothetical protein